MATENQEMLEKLKNEIKKIYKSNNEFFKKFVVANGYNSDDITIENCKKIFQRIQKGKNPTKLDTKRLKEMFNFLQEQSEYKKHKSYKPLVDDKFHKEHLTSDEIEEAIKLGQ
ncbi:hypothetical protein OFO07_05595 [Campylobacter sp. JMF_06 NA1]|uniref:hypothetical protein n=1 Tax=Campylobacter sp. JMF_06 NA1 TaxID=2983823 RepID=UPI0022E9A9B2|nr:hypothetical protein [Campylobacter sp. JMF_06 NA1]MDA3078393.1 hypothetical protein [Campylobacter sp. JMF_06 NA1]